MRFEVLGPEFNAGAYYSDLLSANFILVNRAYFDSRVKGSKSRIETRQTGCKRGNMVKGWWYGWWWMLLIYCMETGILPTLRMNV